MVFYAHYLQEALESPTIVASLTVIITGVAALIPAIVAKIGEAIVEFCNCLLYTSAKIFCGKLRSTLRIGNT